MLTGPTREDVIFLRCAQMLRVRLIVTTQHVILDEAFFGPARAPARRAPRAGPRARRPVGEVRR